LTPTDRDELAVDLFAHRSAFLAATADHEGELSLAAIKSEVASAGWYQQASGKGVLVLHELRRQLGSPLFEDTMDGFGRDHAGQRVSTAEFQAHIEKAAGKPMNEFFDSWVRQPGLPRLRLGKATVMKNSLGWDKVGKTDRSSPGHRVEGEILRVGGGPPVLHVDVTVEGPTGEVTESVALKGGRATFSIAVPSDPFPPYGVVLDKYGSAARSDAATFSILAFNRDLEGSLIVYGTGDEVATNREAAEALQEAVRKSWSNITIPLKSDKEVTEAALKSNHVLLIGRPDTNRLVERFRQALPIAFGSRSFVVRGKTYANAGSAVIAAAANPLNRCRSLVVVAGLAAEATLAAAPALGARGQRPAEVLVLPHGEEALALIIPGPQQVRELGPR
jgi:hypothetical protein